MGGLLYPVRDPCCLASVVAQAITFGLRKKSRGSFIDELAMSSTPFTFKSSFSHRVYGDVGRKGGLFENARSNVMATLFCFLAEPARTIFLASRFPVL